MVPRLLSTIVHLCEELVRQVAREREIEPSATPRVRFRSFFARPAHAAHMTGRLRARTTACACAVPAAGVATPREQHAIAYASASPVERMDRYLPTTGDGPFPVVLWIHGGGWERDTVTVRCAAGYVAPPPGKANPGVRVGRRR